VDSFFGYNFPKPEPVWIQFEIQVRGHGSHSHKKNGGNRPQKFRLRVPKRVLFFLLSWQRGLSATYPAPILNIFEATDVNRFPHAYTGEKFPNFFAENFSGPKTAQNTVL